MSTTENAGDCKWSVRSTKDTEGGGSVTHFRNCPSEVDAKMVLAAARRKRPDMKHYLYRDDEPV